MMESIKQLIILYYKNRNNKWASFKDIREGTKLSYITVSRYTKRMIDDGIVEMKLFNPKQQLTVKGSYNRTFERWVYRLKTLENWNDRL